jgi:hypothetical protein
VNCNDGNVCTIDSCGASGCTHEPFCAQDGVTCNGVEYCLPVPGPFGFIPICARTGNLDCNDGNVCTHDFCAEPTGCEHTAVSCADDNVCTDDSCHPLTGCANTIVPGCCRTAGDCGTNACVQGAQCFLNRCTGGTLVSCNDGDACTQDSCNLTTGCVHAAIPGCCNDDRDCGDACLSPLRCVDRSCVAAAPRTCADGDACTDDGCADGACTFTDKTGFARLGCVCERALPAACAGQPIPKKLTSRRVKACKAIAKAGTAEGARLRKFVGKAAKQLARARSQADKGTAGVSDSCARGLAESFADEQTRADEFRAGL